MQGRIICFLTPLLFGLFWACGGGLASDDQEVLLVKWKDYSLTKAEIVSVLPANFSKDDSTQFVEAYIDNWLKKRILVENARNKIPKQRLEFIQEKVKEYENDLLINEFNSEFVLSRLNEEVTDQEISSYYQTQNESFTLSRDVFQYQFVVLPKADLPLAEPLFRRGDQKSMEQLTKITNQRNLPADLTSESWTSKTEFLQKLPIKISAQDFEDLMAYSYLKIESGSDAFILKITNKKLKGDRAPLSYVKESIRGLLINKRKIHLLDSLESSLMQKEKENIIRQ